MVPSCDLLQPPVADKPYLLLGLLGYGLYVSNSLKKSGRLFSARYYGFYIELNDCTLNPKPQTPNSKLKILNPKPQILNYKF